MNQFDSLITALGQLVAAFAQVAVSLFSLAGALIGPLLWVCFFLFFVRWPDLRLWLRQGAWVAFALLYALVVMSWTLLSQATLITKIVHPDRPWANLVEKGAVGLALVAVAFICGALQDYWNITPPEIEIAGPPEGTASADHAHHGGGHH